MAFFFGKEKLRKIDAKWLKDSGVVFPNFSAAQPSKDSFILVGTVQFNPGRLEFDEGYAEFALRVGRITTVGKGCTFEYSTIAYRGRVAEERQSKAAIEKVRRQKREGRAAVQGRAGAGILKGVQADGQAEGKLQREFGNSSSITDRTNETVINALIEAFPKATSGDGVNCIEWVIKPDELSPLTLVGGEHNVVHGERMREANKGAGLAVVHTVEEGGCIEMQLQVKKADVEWTDVSFGEQSRLHKLGKRLVNGRTKRDIVGRLALATALEGTITVQVLHGSRSDE